MVDIKKFFFNSFVPNDVAPDDGRCAWSERVYFLLSYIYAGRAWPSSVVAWHGIYIVSVRGRLCDSVDIDR